MQYYSSSLAGDVVLSPALNNSGHHVGDLFVTAIAWAVLFLL